MLHSISHMGPKSITRLFNELPSTSLDSIDLEALSVWNLAADTLQRKYRLHPEAASTIAYRKSELMESGQKLSDSVRQLGIRVMTILDSDYPAYLKEFGVEPPPIIYAYGNLGLLREKKFAVVSSNGTSNQGIEVLREFAGTLCDEEMIPVTSHNTVPYQVSGLAAKSRNAPVILVLDRGILSAFPNGLRFEPIAQARIWDMRFDFEKDLVLSRFRLFDPWIGANGIERDRMVFGLSDVVVAVEVRAGGVMEAECLRAYRNGREVYVYIPDSQPAADGNNALLGQGCSPIPGSSARSLLSTLDVLQAPVEGLFADSSD